MDRVRIKLKPNHSCGNSFGTFELIYPNELQGVIEPNEFENTIRKLNDNTRSVLSKKYYLLFLISVVGIILIISGFVKQVSIMEDNFNNFSTHSSTTFSSSGYYNDVYIGGGGGTTGGSINSYNELIISNLKDEEPSSLPLNKNNLLQDTNDFNDGNTISIVPQITLMLIGGFMFMAGFISYAIAYCIFQGKAVEKVRNELEVVNQCYQERRITFSLESDYKIVYIPTREYNFHRHNRAYSNNIKFDCHGLPFKEVHFYILEIQFPYVPRPIIPMIHTPIIDGSTVVVSQQQHHHSSGLGINFGISSCGIGLNIGASDPCVSTTTTTVIPPMQPIIYQQPPYQPQYQQQQYQQPQYPQPQYPQPQYQQPQYQQPQPLPQAPPPLQQQTKKSGFLPLSTFDDIEDN